MSQEHVSVFQDGIDQRQDLQPQFVSFQKAYETPSAFLDTFEPFGTSLLEIALLPTNVHAESCRTSQCG